MPTPVLTKTKSGLYEARWSDSRRSRRKSMGTNERAVAEARFAQWLLIGGHRSHERDAEAHAEAQNAGLTCAELWSTYDALHIQKNVVGKCTQNNTWINLKPAFGHLKPSDISQKVVDGYVEKRRAGLIGKQPAKEGDPLLPAKDTTIRRELGALRACLNWCAKDERKLIDKTDVPTYTLPEEGEPKDRWLRTAEIDAMLTAAREMREARKSDGDRLSRGERFLWLALNTAARKQAIYELTWDRVDFEIGMIHYDVPGRKKTKKRRASVPISAALMPILQRAYRERENEFVMTNKGEMWATIQSIAVRAGLGVRGQPAKNGAKPKATGISPHTLRHTAATHMARRGVPLYTIAGVLGNTLAMVEKIYAKHCPAAMRDAVNVIPTGKD
ncbi:MAG TPA: site-specific integrase [Burkholderiaceae bacterium]